MKLSEKWKQIREGVRKFYSVTLNDIANNHGLAVEYTPELPAKVDGFLDRHELPRFIAVNSKLDSVNQNYAICREVSRLRQDSRLNSMVLSSAKRWRLCDGAPKSIQAQILRLDLEHRSLMMLAFWGKSREYIEYHKRNPTKIFRTGRITLTTDCLFLLLRAREACHLLCWPFRAVLRA